MNIETIRYYQRRGLLDAPAKPFGGYRRYSPEQAKRVRFIKRAQALGFTLAEVGGLVQQCDTGGGGAACPIIDVLPPSDVRLGYPSTWRQRVAANRVRLGPFSTLSDAVSTTSQAST